MKIKRVLNNNAVISSNSRIVMFCFWEVELLFRKKQGRMSILKKVEKTFLLKDRETQNRFTELMIDAYPDFGENQAWKSTE